MSTRTIAVSSKELDSAIEVLSNASQQLQLTRFERFSYHALMISADVLVITAIVSMVLAPPAFVEAAKNLTPDYFSYFRAAVRVVSIGALFAGIVSLALNIPVFRKIFRERARFKELGLNYLYKRLWAESGRSRWIRRVRNGLLMVVGFIYLFGGILFLILAIQPEGRLIGITPFIYGLVISGMMFAARFLRNQRDRMELTASADELSKALQKLRQRSAGLSSEDVETVLVPSKLLEQTAKIESAQIAEERKEAILQSVAYRPTGYAIAFDRDAVEQRATLDVADRVELEDLVEQLSTGTQVKPQVETGQGRTKSNRVEIDYIVDNASRSIRVIAVRHVGEISHASVNGASHA